VYKAQRIRQSTRRPLTIEMNIPGLSLPSKLDSPKVSSVSGSSSTGRPASYSAYTLPPHAMMLVLARFFWCKSNALAMGPPSRMVPKVPRCTSRVRLLALTPGCHSLVPLVWFVHGAYWLSYQLNRTGTLLTRRSIEITSSRDDTHVVADCKK
jgi:hypothetical protein